jgi:Nif-specific regulatory protein
MVLPAETSDALELSADLTELVSRRNRAIWIDNKSTDAGSQIQAHYADAICVPLRHEDSTIGVVHAYLASGHFSQNDFDMAIGIARVLASSLVRALQEATLRADHDRLINQSAAFDELVGESPSMKKLKARIERVARASGCVLIRGESGAGKELVARAIYRASGRATSPMLTVNCAAIPRDLMESQLFGHKRGAFTGADADHIGWFQRANTGTLFLDEVGELTLEGQAKMLRILEGHPFLPVGGSEEITVDVRIIAATNRDLREFVREGRFREDLYYRLIVFELVIPPLRERGDDIDRLIDLFLNHFKLQHGRPHLKISAAARQKLQSYSWPGNVRQLRNVIDSAVVMADDEIDVDTLGLQETAVDEPNSLRIDDWERKLIRQALARTDNNVQQAAKLLGIGRATLYRKLDEYNLK